MRIFRLAKKSNNLLSYNGTILFILLINIYKSYASQSTDEETEPYKYSMQEIVVLKEGIESVKKIFEEECCFSELVIKKFDKYDDLVEKDDDLYEILLAFCDGMREYERHIHRIVEKDFKTSEFLDDMLEYIKEKYEDNCDNVVNSDDSEKVEEDIQQSSNDTVNSSIDMSTNADAPEKNVYELETDSETETFVAKTNDENFRKAELSKNTLDDRIKSPQNENITEKSFAVISNMLQSRVDIVKEIGQQLDERLNEVNDDLKSRINADKDKLKEFAYAIYDVIDGLANEFNINIGSKTKRKNEENEQEKSKRLKND